MNRQRLNKQPIIVNGFGRGGTNILMNLLLSHPDTAMPTGELHKVFRGGAMGEKAARGVFKRIFYNLPIKLMYRHDLFRHPMKIDVFIEPDFSNTKFFKYIDWILYREKQKALHESHNLWKDPTTHYTREDLARARLTVKAHNNLIYLNDIFRSIYKDVRFVAVIRNGFALCEGYMRRGKSVEAAANLYNKIGDQIAQNLSNPDYMCIKFEDIITSPLKAVQKIYSHCGLDPEKCKYFRFQHKSTISKNGKPVLEGNYDRQLVWYAPEDINHHFNTDVNQNQIARLSEIDKRYLENTIKSTMQKFNYL